MKQSIILLATMTLIACDTSSLDNGRIQRDGVELYSVPPIGVAIDGTADEELVIEAIAWWNDQVGAEVFFSPSPTPDVTVSVGYVPGEMEGDWCEVDELGIAYLDYSTFDGLIVECSVVISSDIAYDGDTVLEVAKHELGHCLGLADDPHSLDLNSIMSSPMVWRGEVTNGDRLLVMEFIDR